MESSRTLFHMRALLVCLALAALVLQANCQCYFYDGACDYKQHHYGPFEIWETDDCETCFCYDEYKYYECCSKFYVPTVYGKRCEVIRDKKTCQTLLIDKEGNECEALVGVL